MKLDRQKITALFLELVAIDSPSGEEAGVARFVKANLEAIGIKASQDKCGNLIAKVPGKGAPLMLCAHLDTVEPGRNIKPKIKGDLITSDDKTILGADDKAGVTEILMAVEWLCTSKTTHRPLELVFTRGEETGSHGAKNLDYKKLKAKEALVLDRSGEPQVIVTAAPFVTDITIEIKGKAAHAGHPEHGLSAVKIAADAISKLKLGRLDEETTSNIGILRAGEIRNGVPETALMRAEVRSHQKAKMEREVKLMKQIFENETKMHGGRLAFKAFMECTGYSYAKTEPNIKNLDLLWQQLGEKTIFEKVGGISDTNEFVKHGLKAITIGYGGKLPHSTKENIRLSDMEKVIRLLVAFVSV